MNEEKEVAKYKRNGKYLCHSVEFREDSNSNRDHKPVKAWSQAIH